MKVKRPGLITTRARRFSPFSSRSGSSVGSGSYEGGPEAGTPTPTPPSTRMLGTISENALTPLNEPFQSPLADLCLISSDGLSFKVERTELAVCSSVFRNTLSQSSLPTPSGPALTTPMTPTSPTSPSPLGRNGVTGLGECPHDHDLPEMHFADPTLESSITLSLFLHLLYQLPLPVPTRSIYFAAYETLTNFILKYGCRPLHRPLAGIVSEWVKDGIVSASKGFKMGDVLDQMELRVQSVKMAGEYSWAGACKAVAPPSTPKGTKEGDGGGKAKSRLLDIEDDPRRSHSYTVMAQNGNSAAPPLPCPSPASSPTSYPSPTSPSSATTPPTPTTPLSPTRPTLPSSRSYSKSSPTPAPIEPRYTSTPTPTPAPTPNPSPTPGKDGLNSNQIQCQFNIHKDGLEGASSLDLTAVPYEYFCSLSDKAKFALLRACRTPTREEAGVGGAGFGIQISRATGAKDWDQVAEEFEKIFAGL